MADADVAAHLSGVGVSPSDMQSTAFSGFVQRQTPLHDCCDPSLGRQRYLPWSRSPGHRPYRRIIEVSLKAAVLLSPDKRFHFKASHDYEQVLLRLDRSAIAEAWCRLTAQECAPDIYFDAIIPLHMLSWQVLLPMLHWVVRCSSMGPGQDAAQTALLAQTEILVATTLLLHQPHSMAGHLWPVPPPSTPQALRRAQAYMLEHLGERLPIAMIASHCGQTVRHLQALFQNECGQSPLQWLRVQRLQAVRQALSQDGGASNISDHALRFGFTHLGEFSRAYRQAFGETPRETRGK